MRRPSVMTQLIDSRLSPTGLHDLYSCASSSTRHRLFPCSIFGPVLYIALKTVDRQRFLRCRQFILLTLPRFSGRSIMYVPSLSR